MKMADSIKSFFLFSSGAYLTVLNRQECQGEHNKYVGIGTAVFFTSVFALVSSSFALYTVFLNWWIAIPVGFIWGGFIFSLDRYIVSTLKKELKVRVENKFLNSLANRAIEVVKASPRIALAIILAMIISKPLELAVFNSEIKNQLVEDQIKQEKSLKENIAAKYKTDIDRLEKEINTFQSEIDLKQKAFDHLTSEANKEADGTGGSGKANRGPIYQAKAETASKAEVDLNTTKSKNAQIILEKRIEKDSLVQKIQLEFQNADRTRVDGLLGRISALETITKKDKALANATFAIFILFLCIELAPLLFKILSDKGNYDVIMNGIEEKTLSEQIEEISKINIDTDDRIKLKIGETENIRKQNLNDNLELLNKISSAQLSVAQEIIDIWKSDELRKIRENPEKYVATLRKDQANEETGQ